MAMRVMGNTPVAAYKSRMLLLLMMMIMMMMLPHFSEADSAEDTNQQCKKAKI